MSKVDAPDVEPTAASLPKKPALVSAPTVSPRLHNRYMDFAPRRKIANDDAAKAPAPAKKHPASPAPVRPTVSRPVAPRPVAPAPRPAPRVTAVASRGFVDGMPVDPKKVIKPASNVPLIEPEIEEEDDGPMAEFNELDTEEEYIVEEPLEEAQEDFIEEDDPEDYVETVLSQVSETRTETTVRRSPFLKNFHIEKRPLSNDVPAGESLIDPEDDGDTLAASDEEERPAHRFSAKSHRPSIKPGIAPAKAPKPAKSATKPHRPETAIVPAPAEKSSSRLGTILTILITILLGAGVGVFVYLAFFQ